MQASTHERRVEPDRLPKGTPNALIVLIVLIDDAGFGVQDIALTLHEVIGIEAPKSVNGFRSTA